MANTGEEPPQEPSFATSASADGDAAAIAETFDQVQESLQRYAERTGTPPHLAPLPDRLKNKNKAKADALAAEQRDLLRKLSATISDTSFAVPTTRIEDIYEEYPNLRPPPPQPRPWTYARPTFGPDFLTAAAREDQADAASGGKRKCLPGLTPGLGRLEGTTPSFSPWKFTDPTLRPRGSRFNSGRSGFLDGPTQEEIDNFVAFAHRAIPTPKRTKTDGADEAGGEDKTYI